MIHGAHLGAFPSASAVFINFFTLAILRLCVPKTSHRIAYSHPATVLALTCAREEWTCSHPSSCCPYNRDTRQPVFQNVLLLPPRNSHSPVTTTL